MKNRFVQPHQRKAHSMFAWRGILAAGLLLGTQALAAEKAPPPPLPPMPTPTAANLAYGPHERNVLDFWHAPGNERTPVLVLIHGGGWLGGSKNDFTTRKGDRQLFDAMMANGISVASISYRLSTQAPLPAPVLDAARAIQFLRFKAAELNLDPAHIAATGGSAGGCTTLWLAAHPDIADPKAEDPVLRQSSRLCGAVADSAQSTIEPKVIREKVIEDALKHMMICRAGGFSNNQDLDANYAKVAELYREFSPVTHVSADDPPVLLLYADPLDSQKNGIHHSRFGVLYKEAADKAGAPCHLSLRGADAAKYPGAPQRLDFFLYVLTGKPLPVAQPVAK